MTEALSPSTGWAVLHLFGKIRPGVDREALVAAVKDMEGDDHQVVPVAILGHKADIAFLAIGPDLWRLRRFQTAVQAAGVEVADSYLSLTEVSEYASHLTEGMKKPRLYPNLPPEGKTAFCFYPMSKRRGEKDNWFTLPFDERMGMMAGHGKSGRNFAGRVLQLVTGSTGIDDFEWGVTLFAVHPDDLKECVYTMRFDEASALFAEFGSFYTGMVADLDEVLAATGV